MGERQRRNVAGGLSYAEAGRAMRHSQALARSATPAEKVILAAVHNWTLSYSKATDRVSLGQLAITAGMWDEAAKDCPRAITRRVGQRLRRLAELGAIDYEPGGGDHGRGYISTVSVTLDPVDRKGDPEQHPSDEKGDADEDPFDDRKGDPECHEGGPSVTQKGDAEDPPPEKGSMEDSEQLSHDDLYAREEAQREIDRKRGRGEEIKNEAALFAYLVKQFTRDPVNIPAKIQSARAWALTYANSSAGIFEDALARQADWLQYPEVLDAARDARRSAKQQVH